MRRSREILVFLILLLVSLFLYGDDSKIPYMEIKENPKTEVNTVVADKNGRDKQLNLNVNKLVTQKLQLAPLIEYGENGERYYVFEIEKEEDNNKEYKYFVTDDKLSIPRKNIVNGKKIGENQSKVLEFTVETRDRTEDEGEENLTLEESKVKEKEKIDAVKIKIDSNLTGDYIYIVKTDKTGTEAFKVYSYKLYKSKSISSKAIDLPNVGKWAALVLLEANQDIPNPLFETGAVEGIDEYKFYDNQFVYIGRVETENVNDRTVKFMVRLMDMKDVANNPRYGQTIEVDGRWSNAGNAIYFGSQKVAGGEINTEYLLAVRGLGGKNNHHVLANSTKGPNGEGQWTPTLQEQGSDVVIRNVSRVVNICYLWASIFSNGLVYGTPDKTEWYRLATVKLPSNLAPGLYYLEAGSFYGLIRLRTSQWWLWESDVAKSGKAYYEHPNVDIFYEKPVPYMGIMATRDAILNRDVVLDGRDATLVVNNKVKIAKWINSQTIEAGKSLGGYHDIFYYMFPAKNQAYFQLENGENGKRNTMVIPQGLSRGEYKLDIRAGIVNNTNDGIMVLKGKNLRIADTNDGIDEFNVWYIDKTVNSELDVNLSEVHIGTRTGWAPKSINNTAIGTNVGKSYGGTKSGINADGAILKKVSGEVFDSLEWSPNLGKFVMGADKVVATDNGVACEVIKDQQSKTQIVKVKNSQGEVVAYVGIEGSETNLGYIFVEKVRRDYKPHRIVLEALDRKGYSFGTITMNLTLDEVKPLGYIGAEISQELLTAMKTDNKTYYTLNGTDGTRNVATIGGVGNSNIQVPQFTNVELDLATGLNLTGISYNELKREYTHGTGMKALCADLTNIRYWETTKGTVIDANYQSMEPTPNIPITKVYTDFNQFYKDITVDMVGVSETNAGHPSETDDFRFVIQSKKKSGVYGNSYVDDVLKETITDNGEFFEVRVIPMIVPKTPEGNFTINANTPTKYDYMYNGVPYEYIFTNDTAAYNKDLGIAKRDDVVSTRPSTAIGTNPNGSIPPRYSSFDTTKEISTEMQVNTSTITGTKYQDAKARYEFELTKNGTNNVPAMSFKIKTPFKIDETIVVTTRTKVAGLNTAIETGKSTIKIVAGSDIIVGNADIDFTKVRKNDVAVWENSTISKDIAKRLDYSTDTTKGVALTFSGIAMENINGEILTTTKLLTTVPTGAIVKVKVDGVERTGVNGVYSTSDIDIKISGKIISITKKTDRITSSNIEIEIADALGKVLLQNSFNLIDNSATEKVAEETMTVYKNYKYFLPSNALEIKYISKDGRLYTALTQIGNSNSYTGNSQINYNSQIIATKGLNNIYLNSNQTGLGTTGTVYPYTTKNVVKYAGHNIFVGLQSAVDINGNFDLPIIYDLTSNTKNTITGKKEKYDLTNSLFEWLANDNTIKSINFKVNMVDYKTEGEGKVDFTGKIIGEKVLWSVNPPAVNGEDLVFEQANTINLLQNATGEFFPTKIDATNSLDKSIGVSNIPNKLVVEMYSYDSNTNSYVTTPTKTVTISSTSATSLRSSSTDFSDIYIGISNGDFYVEKKENRIQKAKYVITAKNNNGELGTFSLIVESTPQLHSFGTVTYNIFEPLKEVIVKDTPNVKWIGGTNGQTLYTYVGATNTFTESSEKFNEYMDRTDALIFPAGQKLKFIGIEKDRVGTTAGTELTKIVGNVYGINGTPEIEISSTINAATEISSITGLKLDDIKINTKTAGKYSIKFFNEADGDIYYYDVALSGKTVANIDGEGKISLAGIEKNRELEFDISGKIIGDTVNGLSIENGKVVYLGIDNTMIPQQVIFTKNIEASKTIGVTLDGMTKQLKIDDSMNTIKIKNGKLYVTKKDVTFEDIVYKLALSGYKANNGFTSLGTFILRVTKETPIERTEILSIENRLFEENSDYNLVNLDGLAKIGTTDKVVAGDSITFKSQNDTMVEIKEVLSVFDNTTKLTTKTEVNGMNNYGDKVYLPKTITATKVSDLLKNIYFNTTPLKLLDAETTKTVKYSIQYIGTDNKVYNLIVDVVVNRGVIIDGNAVLDFGQLLYNSSNNFHYGDTEVTIKALKAGRNVRIELKNQDIELSTKTTPISKMNVKNLGVKLITPAPKPADEKTSGTVVGTDGKATFKVSGYAEVLKTTQVGKYFGEATVDVYITD